MSPPTRNCFSSGNEVAVTVTVGVTVGVTVLNIVTVLLIAPNRLDSFYPRNFVLSKKCVVVTLFYVIVNTVTQLLKNTSLKICSCETTTFNSVVTKSLQQ